VRRANDELQQTKPAIFSVCAGFAAELRRSPDRSGKTPWPPGIGVAAACLAALLCSPRDATAVDCKPCRSTRGGCVQGQVVEPRVGAEGWDEAGEVAVTLADSQFSEPKRTTDGTVLQIVTDEHGAFFIEDVPPGEYAVVVTGMGYNAVYQVGLSLLDVETGVRAGFLAQQSRTTNLQTIAVDFEGDTPQTIPAVEYCE